MKSRSTCHLLGFFCCLKVGCSIWWQAENNAILTLQWRSLHSCYFADCNDKVAQLNTLHFCCSTELISLWFLRVHKTRNILNTGRLLPPTDDVFEWFVKKKITTTHVVVFDSDGKVRRNKVVTGKLSRGKALFLYLGKHKNCHGFLCSYQPDFSGNHCDATSNSTWSAILNSLSFHFYTPRFRQRMTFCMPTLEQGRESFATYFNTKLQHYSQENVRLIFT